MSDTALASAVDFDVYVGAYEIPDQEILSFTIDLDFDQPSMAVVTLRNQGHRHSSTWLQGEPLEIKVHDDSKLSVFNGSIVGIEPLYKADGNNRCVLRAYDPLHLLLRGRKSRTFQDKSDKKIVEEIAGEYGLKPSCGSAVNITHKHIYQHNQTDLEFLRTRAARLGYSVWVEGKELFFDKPRKDKSSNVEFKVSTQPIGGHHLKSFAPRMSSAAVVKKVTVQGWDPEKKEKIVGEAEAKDSPLGKANASTILTGPFAKEPMSKTFVVDHPIASPEEAKAIAEAKLEEHMLGYITGEAEAFGKPEYKPGMVVKIVINEDQADDRFNGSYLITGVTHRYVRSGGPGDGYMTVLRVARDAEKPK